MVRFIENVVEWRKQVAGKSCRKLCRVSERIGLGGLGSDRRAGQGIRTELKSGTKVVWQEGRPLLRVGPKQATDFLK